MSAWITARSLAAFLAALACLGGWDLVAAESAPPTGLEKVGTDLAAAKALPSTASQTSLGISRSALPDWQGAEPAFSPARRATGKNAEREAKATNWLLDAMNPPASSVDENRALDGKADVTDPTQRLSGKDSSPRANSEKAAATTEPSGVKLRFGQAVAPNPLAQFLGGWMTPQDYALLKPVPTGGSNLGAPSRGLDSLASGGSVQRPDLSNVVGMFGGAAGSKKSAASSTPRDNPYLQALAVPSIAPIQPSQVSIPSSISPARPAISGASVQPFTNAAAPAKEPDLPAESDDEKYFKQLKRF